SAAFSASPPGGHERPREGHQGTEHDAAAEAEPETAGGQIDQHDQHEGDDHLPGAQAPQTPVPGDAATLLLTHASRSIRLVPGRRAPVSVCAAGVAAALTGPPTGYRSRVRPAHVQRVPPYRSVLGRGRGGYRLSSSARSGDRGRRLRRWPGAPLRTLRPTRPRSW